MDSKYQVVSVGSATLDVFVRSRELTVIDSNDSHTGSFLQVPYGTKAEVEELVIQSGGGGTNTAVGFKRLGLTAAVLARSGNDFAGRLVRQELEKEGVGLDYLISIEGDQTDYSTILIGPDGGRTILVSRGKTHLEIDQVPFDRLRADWYYVSSIEGNLELLDRLLDHASQTRAQVVINPGRKELAQPEKLISLLNRAQVVILNREEAAKLTGLAIGDDRVLVATAQLVSQLAVVTEGSKGAVVYDNQDRQLVGVGFRVRQEETTGAGDGFGCGFTAGLIRGRSLEESLWLGMANGASVVTKTGAKTGLLYTGELSSWPRERVEIDWK